MRGSEAKAAERPSAGAGGAAAAVRRGAVPAGRALVAAFALLAAAAPAARADLPEHPRIARATAPSWVAPAGPLRPSPAGATAVGYRLVDDQVFADGDDSAVYFQRVVEVLSQQGLQDAAQWEAVFDPGSQRLVVHALEIFRDGAWTDRLVSSRASVLQREPELSRRIYDESLTLLLVVEDVRVGDLLRIAYTVEGFNPILGDRYAGAFILGWSVPVAEQRLRVVAPADRLLHYRLLGAGAPEPERTIEGGLKTLSWHRFDPPPVKSEADVPPGWFSHPFAQLSQFDDWAEVAEWGRALYPPQPPPAELTEVAVEIAGAHPGDAGAQTVAAARWVQDRVRYFAIALGPHSHEPHGLAEIARRRYGDCKDKARLLVGLLAALGIEAWPALVESDHGEEVGRFHPSPFAFDHVVVVALPYGPRGRRVWIDPTVELQGAAAAGEIWLPPYGSALELRPGADALSALPEEQTRPGVTAIRYDYRIGEAGEPFEVDIETVHERAGAERLRRTLASTSAEELQDLYVDFYSDGERTVEPRAPLEIADDRQANRLAITERYRVVGCWRRAEAALDCELLPLTLNAELVEPATSARSHPLRLPRDLHTRETVSIQAATPWEFEPVDEAERNPWFEFTVSSTPRERSIELVYELKTRARMVEPEHVARYARALEAMIGSTGYHLEVEQPLERTPPGFGEAKDPLEPLYTTIGCFVIAAPPLGLVVAVVIAIVAVRRLNRRRSALATQRAAVAPAAPPAACPRCGGVTPPGARFCAGCGAPVVAASAPASGGGAEPVVTVIAVAVGGLMLVGVIGIIAALVIPNFIDALGKARQKRTLADMRVIAANLEDHRARNGRYPASTADDVAAVIADEIGVHHDLPTLDAWKNPLRYVCWRTDRGVTGCDDYRLASAGADGAFEHDDLADYPGETFERNDVDRDLVLGPEGVIQGPADP